MLLEAIYRQSFPVSQVEVLIIDAMSTDGTRQNIQAFQQDHPDLRVKVLDNQKKTIPSALNIGLKTAEGEWVVRLDAHSMPDPQYIQRCVEALQAGLGDNVGGVWEIRPSNSSRTARAISIAAAHRLGVGDALYRYTSQAGYVDTVPFGSFRRSLIEKIGLFDEDLLANEDYEFNARLRGGGGRVWLDPAIRSVYFARPTIAALARQYWRYGFWKWRMLRRYPQTLRWRQALPPLFVTSLIILIILFPFWRLARLALGCEILIYTGIVLTASLLAAIKQKDITLTLGIGTAIATMHICWGAGFLWSLGRSGVGKA